MCCLFGFIDYNHNLSGKQKNRLLRSLASAAEERGTDAAGIAYHAGGRLHIMKKASPPMCCGSGFRKKLLWSWVTLDMPHRGTPRKRTTRIPSKVRLAERNLPWLTTACS